MRNSCSCATWVHASIEADGNSDSVPIRRVNGRGVPSGGLGVREATPPIGMEASRGSICMQGSNFGTHIARSVIGKIDIAKCA